MSMPSNFAWSNPHDCRATVSAPYPKVLPLHMCQAFGRGPRPRATFTSRISDHSVGDWLLATKINVPMNAGVSRTMEFQYRSPSGWENVSFPFSIVRGGEETARAGGHAVEAAMRPQSLAVGRSTRISFVFEISTPINKNGAMVIVPPRGMSLAGGGCTDESVAVGVLNLSTNSNEKITADGASGDWQCSKKGVNGIWLKRISSVPVTMFLQVSFQMTLSGGSSGSKAGQAAIMTCTNGDACDVITHAQYLADSNYLDYGLTRNDVNVQ
eukprot:Platyproteum_vivax@DN7544_c0_g1_i10.p1